MKLQLTTLKPLHVQWLTELYNHMTNEWDPARIREALDEGLEK